MTKITYIQADGREQLVEVQAGITLMEAAKNNGVAGILADCGGSCACGTCRVYVDAAWQAKVGEATEMEAATIEAFEDAAQGTRLACQVNITDQLDGLVVRIPASQF